jgi:hypothetical protein
VSASTAGMSRRAVLGLGLSTLRERLDAAGPAPPPRPRTPERPALDDVRARWAQARDAELAAELWAPVVAELRRAAPVATEIEGPLAALPYGDGELDAVLSPFDPQMTPDGRAAIHELFRVVRPGGTVAFSVWTTGPVSRLLQAAGELDPGPRGLAEPWAWGRRERLRQDLDHVADPVSVDRLEVELVLDRTTALDALAGAVAPVGAALARSGARERLGALLAREGSVEGDALRVTVPYLLVSATRR